MVLKYKDNMNKKEYTKFISKLCLFIIGSEDTRDMNSESKQRKLFNRVISKNNFPVKVENRLRHILNIHNEETKSQKSRLTLWKVGYYQS